MLKPGQLFTYQNQVFQVTKAESGKTCRECEAYYKEHLLKRPCEILPGIGCCKYCGFCYYPKLVESCGK